jgi:hypothetical protein
LLFYGRCFFHDEGDAGNESVCYVLCGNSHPWYGRFPLCACLGVRTNLVSLKTWQWNLNEFPLPGFPRH